MLLNRTKQKHETLKIKAYEKIIWMIELGAICDALHDLVPFVQFKKHEKHPWRSVTFRSKSNRTKGTKSHNARHISPRTKGFSFSAP